MIAEKKISASDIIENASNMGGEGGIEVGRRGDKHIYAMIYYYSMVQTSEAISKIPN